MNFIDDVNFQVSAGNGGRGCASFRRERCIPKGGPDGGDGGDGGSVYLLADAKINTLINFRNRRLYQAKSGGSGMGKQRTGKKGEDLILQVPVGTLVCHADTGELLGDLAEDQKKICVARGGKGGIGNIHFKSSTNRSPRRFTLGDVGESRPLHLELKLLADVGLLGLPNAGKSTFMRVVSSATPKVADYPFTTLHPQLAIVQVDHRTSWVLADIPGLIAGASHGTGLGIRFLRHLSRCRLLLHIVDANELYLDDTLQRIDIILQELKYFSTDLTQKPIWLVLNKIELLPLNAVEELQQRVAQLRPDIKHVYTISALQRQGIQKLCKDIATRVSQLEA